MLLDDDVRRARDDLTTAIGLIAAIEQCPCDDAARLLVAAARRANRALADVAADVVQAARLATSSVTPAAPRFPARPHRASDD